MRILIVDIYYRPFLHWCYGQHPGLEHQLYSEQLHFLLSQCFGTADFYSFNLMKLGHEAKEIIANCEPLQRQWARENGLRMERHWPKFTLRHWHGLPFPMLHRNYGWLFGILVEQIKAYKPDVLYVQDLGWIPQDILGKIREYVHLVVAQHGSALPHPEACVGYDLILSCVPTFVESFRKLGVRSEFLALGFEAKVLQWLERTGVQYKVTHIGGYDAVHSERNAILEQVAQRVGVDFWGYGIDDLPPDSIIRRRFRGMAWGLDMYRIRHNSQIVLNKHINSVAGRFAANMTLFEATGVGTCLVTDRKDNLHEFFEPEKEVIGYASAEECVEKISYLLEHEGERAAVAAAGQQRTLCRHTYYQRMQEFVNIVQNHL